MQSSPNFPEKCIEQNKLGKCNADCCGVVQLPTPLYDANKNKMQAKVVEEIRDPQQTYPITEDHKCAFLNRQTKQCSIYKVRPEVCRLFGTHTNLMLQCPHLKPNGNSRSLAQKKQYRRRNDRTIDLNISKMRKRLKV